jgi:hypothetical protein
MLERVRQAADIMPKRQLERVLTKEIGADWPTKFRQFDLEPLAAASIGQVCGVCLSVCLFVCLSLSTSISMSVSKSVCVSLCMCLSVSMKVSQSSNLSGFGVSVTTPIMCLNSVLFRQFSSVVTHMEMVVCIFSH